MQCPVCSGKAENLTPNTMEGVVVGCTECGDYRISGGVFYAFTRMQADQRRAALADARLTAKHGWPVIGNTSLSLR
jgi:hypothetical protein